MLMIEIMEDLMRENERLSQGLNLERFCHYERESFEVHLDTI